MTLPPHGRLACRRCYDTSGDTLSIGKWQAVNDPGAWGSSTPTVLVLGFSKGFTQAAASREGKFEEIPFKKMRARLTEMLRALGVLPPHDSVDGKFTATERDFAFGSLVRCSLSRRNEKNGRLECTGQVMPKAFVEEVSSIVRRCAETFLSELPPTLRLVLLLGTGDAYIAGCREVIRALYGPSFRELNSVSYQAGGVVWVHVSHPSGMNGHHASWISGSSDSTQGAKRELALRAVRLAMGNGSLASARPGRSS